MCLLSDWIGILIISIIIRSKKNKKGRGNKECEGLGNCEREKVKEGRKSARKKKKLGAREKRIEKKNTEIEREIKWIIEGDIERGKEIK